MCFTYTNSTKMTPNHPNKNWRDPPSSLVFPFSQLPTLWHSVKPLQPLEAKWYSHHWINYTRILVGPLAQQGARPWGRAHRWRRNSLRACPLQPVGLATFSLCRQPSRRGIWGRKAGWPCFDLCSDNSASPDFSSAQRTESLKYGILLCT